MRACRRRSESMWSSAAKALSWGCMSFSLGLVTTCNQVGLRPRLSHRANGAGPRTGPLTSRGQTPYYAGVNVHNSHQWAPEAVIVRGLDRHEGPGGLTVRRLRSRLIGPAAAVCAALVVVGCGGGGSSSKGTSTNASNSGG